MSRGPRKDRALVGYHRRMRIQAIAVAALLSGCAEEERTGRSDTLYWNTFEGLQRPTPEMLTGAEEILGLELVQSEDSIGATTIFFGEPESGSSWSGGWSCTPFVWLEVHTPRVLAHELGHAYGLSHTDDPDNIMAPGTPGVELTDDQTEAIREALWFTDNYCPYPS